MNSLLSFKRPLSAPDGCYPSARILGRMQLLAYVSIGGLVSFAGLDLALGHKLLYLSMTCESLGADFIAKTAVLANKQLPQTARHPRQLLRLAHDLSLRIVTLVPLDAGQLRRILVVEDLVLNQMIVKRMLERLGYHAETASNGQEALACLERAPFDLVLMDCQMPVLDGYDASQAVRSSKTVLWSEVPIVAFTGSASREERDRCLASGMDDFVNKPIDLQELGEVLKRWIGQRSPPPHRLGLAFPRLSRKRNERKAV